MIYLYGTECAAERVMSRMFRSILIVGAALLGLGGTLAVARADTETYANDTEVAYYSGTSPTEVSGSYWDNTLGTSSPSADYTGGIGAATFYTPSVTVSLTSIGGGMSTVTITFDTGLYTGSTKVGGTNVYAADIFIGAGSSAPDGSYDYAISLGFDSADGGNSSAGLYELPTSKTSSAYKTSQQVWGGRSGYVYGGAYAVGGKSPACSSSTSPTSCKGAYASPTVLLSKSSGGDASAVTTGITSVKVSDCADSKTCNSGTAAGELSVAITGSTTLLDSIFSDFDLFWGTGDCSNAPIWENVDFDTAVPEPSTLAILASALGLLAFMARRRRRVLSLPLA